MHGLYFRKYPSPEKISAKVLWVKFMQMVKRKRGRCERKRRKHKKLRGNLSLKGKINVKRGIIYERV
jgi:hypothetical protein